VPAKEVTPPFVIAIQISRGGDVVYDGNTSTDRMARPFDELAAYLGRALRFPVGAFLMTGTGLVPEGDFTLAAGDVVTISIDGLGTLENEVERVGITAPG
jgi:2-dehydro-3-deoxy-D-arabinonate dehydratase